MTRNGTRAIFIAIAVVVVLSMVLSVVPAALR